MIFKKLLLIPAFLIFTVIFFSINGCSSGEYEIEEHETSYVEKQIKIDTIWKVTESIDSSKINKDKNKDDKKDSFTFIVQIGAYVVQSNFERFFATAQSKLGNEVYNDKSGEMNRIRIGKYSNKADALIKLDYVKSLGYYDSFIVTVRK